MKRMPEALTDGTFDLLILGGGITGAGVALDAALRGLRVALIDKGDFASGTSCASSKLIHGGLRYLEQGEFGLVREALHERGRLLHNAPHLVQPLQFLLPFYRGSRVPPWKWRLGLYLYDVLAGRENLRRSRGLSLPQLLSAAPHLRREDLSGGAEYYDAQMDDARLCIEVLQTASRKGAVVLNYVEATTFTYRDSVIGGVLAQDHVSGKELRIDAHQVLNATGPWVDDICRLARDGDGPHLRTTKGVHLVLPNRELRAGLLLLHPRDGRVFFVLPWLGKTLVGTTDTDEERPPEALEVTHEDIHYLMEGYRHYFPTLPIDLLGSFAGLRPLLRSEQGEPSSVSREYRLFWSPSGLLSVTGGKYTTYRHMAEVITDAIVARWGLRRRVRTRMQPLDGTPREPWLEFRENRIERLRHQGLSESSARHLIHRYGQRAFEVMEYVKRDPALKGTIHPDEPDIRAELAYQHEHEMAVFPDDFLLRRTRLGLFHGEMLKDARRRGSVLDSRTTDMPTTLTARPRQSDTHPGPAIIAS